MQTLGSLNETARRDDLHKGPGELDVHVSSSIKPAGKCQLNSFACFEARWKGDAYQWTGELVTQKSNILREAVAVFTTADDLQAAVDELLSSGFHRAELSLLAGEDTLNEKLGRDVANVRDLEDDPTAPRSAYISPEAIGDAQGGIVGALMYAGATAAAGAMFVSGGTILGALVVATVVGGAGGVVGALLAKWLGDNHGRYLQAQIDHGGLLLWVRTKDPEAEVRALDILRYHSSRDVHIHTMSPKPQRSSETSKPGRRLAGVV
jgi:hypothetical protein